MRHGLLKLIGLIGSVLGVMLMSACTAEPTPVVQLPTRPATLAGQGPTVPPAQVAVVPTVPATDRTATVERGTVRTAVNASGKLEPARSIKLSFGAAGNVTEILVSEGQPVKAGEVLARLDTGDLELAVAQAQRTLAAQQLQYSLVMTPTRAEVSAARAALASATANLAALQSLPDPRQVEIARLQMELAKGDARPIAELQYALAQRGSSEAQIAAASAQIAQAQAQLDRLLLTDDRQRTLAALPLQQAELDVQAAQRRLDQAQLVSPIDGVLASLTLALGDRVDANPVAVVSDASAYNVTFVVDEASVGLLSSQQPAVVGVAMLPDQTLSGQVKSIASMPTEAAGVTGYRVVVSLDKTGAPLRSGLSVNVAVVVGVSENVLVIPSWAIRTDRSTGKTYVYIKRGSQVEETEIVTGLYDLNQIEVKSGVNEGDVLVSPPRTLP